MVSSKVNSIANGIYFYLQPNLDSRDEDIARFEVFMKKVEAGEQCQSSDRLVKWLKESICEMRQNQTARALAEGYDAKL